MNGAYRTPVPTNKKMAAGSRRTTLRAARRPIRTKVGTKPALVPPANQRVEVSVNERIITLSAIAPMNHGHAVA
jgi:hypothetical protein